jgi:hypothetical protein
MQTVSAARAKEPSRHNFHAEAHSMDPLLKDFLTAPLSTKLLIDIFLPPPFVFLCWASGNIKAFLWHSKAFAFSAKDCLHWLVASYILMSGLTIYSYFY